MEVLVIGLGSMGRRRIRLIRRYDKSIHIVGVDFNEERRKQAEEICSIRTYDSVDNALDKEQPDCCFVSSSPLSHAGIIGKCLRKHCNVFTELNLVVDGYDENMVLAEQEGILLFLSSTQLYRSELQYIKKCVKSANERCDYIYHVGQYLPDWHPWEDYRNYFVGQVKTNACREIMAIEFPWLVDSFGEIKNIYRQKSKNSELDIDYDDNYMISIEHENGHKGFLCIDILCRIPIRFLEVFGENIYIKWSGTPESLYNYQISAKKMEQVRLYSKIDKLVDYNETIIENDYFAEITEFFESVKGNAKPRYSFQKDKKILELIDRIEAED